MKSNTLLLVCIVGIIALFASCGILSRTGASAGAGGTNTGIGVHAEGHSVNNYDLVPVGNRITYTIDISTPEEKQKLNGLSLPEAQRLAEIEASRKFNCDRLIDPRFDYLKNGKRILRITVDGRPGIYKMRDNRYNSRTRQEIDVNINNNYRNSGR